MGIDMELPLAITTATLLARQPTRFWSVFMGICAYSAPTALERSGMGRWGW